MTAFSRVPLVLALLATPAFADVARENPEPPSHPPEAHVDPQADRLLRQMTDYLAGLQSFRVMSQSTDEVVTQDGRKIELAADSEISVSRPSRLKSERLGADNGMAFFADGKTMTLYCKPSNTFATVAAPSTIDSTIDTVRREYKIDAPGADLLYSRPYEILTEQVTGGQLIGKETVEGVATNHLAFQGHDVDWQIWIQEGPQPLPRRFVITTKDVKNEPEFTLQLSRWEPQAKIADSAFEFQPPPGAKKIASFPTSCGAAHSH